MPVDVASNGEVDVGDVLADGDDPVVGDGEAGDDVADDDDNENELMVLDPAHVSILLDDM